MIAIENMIRVTHFSRKPIVKVASENLDFTLSEALLILSFIENTFLPLPWVLMKEMISRR